MQKRMKIVSILLVLAMMFSLLAGCGDSGEETGDVAPAITMGTEFTIPDTAYVGQVISLPTATSTNAADGSVITVGVKVTTTKSNGNQGTAMTEKAATSVQSFTVPADVKECQVIYRAQDPGTELSSTKEYKIKVQEDNEAPVITLSSSEAITTTSANGVVLPTAKVTDAPLNQDITATALRVTVSQTDGTESQNVTSYALQGSRFYLPADNYTVTYTASDTAGNEAESKSISVTVSDTEERYSGNLLSPASVVIGNDASFNSRGELIVGKTSATAQDGDNSSATLAGYKFKEGEYVSAVFTIDPITDAPEEYFAINYVSSGNYNSLLPDGNEGANAPRIVLRFSRDRVQILLDTAGNLAGSANSGGNHTAFISNDGFRDGNVHIVYMQVLRYVGDKRATDEAYDTEGARIVFNVWCDVLPTEAPTLVGIVTCGETTSASGTGELASNQFREAWENPYGYLNFGGRSTQYTEAGVWNDDAMHIRGIYAYEEGETEFADTTPPVITVSEVPDTIAVINQAFTLPAATATDGAVNTAVLVHIYNENREQIAEITDLSSAKNYTFTEEGVYWVSYESADETGNINWVEYSVRVLAFADTDDPEIELSVTSLTGKVGDAVTLPDVSVSDKSDPNGITLGLTISGPEEYSNYFVNGQQATFTPLTAGVYTLTYWAEDSTGNRAEAVVSLTVEHKAAGNVLDGVQTVPLNKTYVYSGEKIYRQKVSMYLNANVLSGSIMMQITGETGGNQDWPEGLVLIIRNDYIMLRAGGWSGWRYGYFESWTGWNAFKADNTYVRFEYQVSDVTVEEEDYLLVQVWVNGVQLRATLDASMWGKIGENGGILIPKDGKNGLNAGQKGSLLSGYFTISMRSDFAGNSDASVAALCIDGTSVEESDLPEGCVWNKDTNPTMPAGGTGVTDMTETITVNADDGMKMIENTSRKLTDNVLQSVTLKLQFSAENTSARIRLLGTGESGIDLAIGDSTSGKGYATIQAGGSVVGWIKESEGTTGDSGENTAYRDAFIGNAAFYLNIAVSYVTDTNGKVTAVNIALKFSNDGEDWENIYIYRTGATGANSDFNDVSDVRYDYSYATGNQGYAAALNVYPWLAGGEDGLKDSGIGVQALETGTVSVLSVKAENV